jgi:ankyrin repeat protein
MQADVNASGRYKDSLPHCACSEGLEATVRLPADRGAHVDEPDSFGDTPSSGCTHVWKAALLIQAGADANIRDGDGYTATTSSWPLGPPTPEKAEPSWLTEVPTPCAQ